MSKNRYETTFTLTVSILAESEEAAEHESTRAQIRLLESKVLGKNARITYLEPSDLMDHMESGAYRP